MRRCGSSLSLPLAWGRLQTDMCNLHYGSFTGGWECEGAGANNTQSKQQHVHQGIASDLSDLPLSDVHGSKEEKRKFLEETASCWFD